MMDDSNKSQNDLLQILTEVFAFEETTETKETKTITIKEMTYEDLNKLIVKARIIIVKMYLQCEIDFEEGILIFRAITELVQQKTLDKQTEYLSTLSTTENIHNTLINRLINTKKQLEHVINEYNNAPSESDEQARLVKDIEQYEKILQEEFHDTAHKTNIPPKNIEEIQSIILAAKIIYEKE